MSKKMGTIQQTYSVGGVSYSKKTQLDANAVAERNQSIAGAKTGALTTRTSDTVGEITAQAAHGIATADKISIFWTEAGALKHRRGVVVGTVAVNQLPITGGLGDNLPPDETALTLMKEVPQELRFDGTDLIAMAASVPNIQAVIILTGDDDAEDFAIVFPQPDGTYSYAWPDVAGTANPITGDVITKARMMHGNVNAQTLKVAAGYT